MKILLLKALLFIFTLVLFASCQQHSCPAYSNINYKQANKPVFLADKSHK